MEPVLITTTKINKKNDSKNHQNVPSPNQTNRFSMGGAVIKRCINISINKLNHMILIIKWFFSNVNI